MVLALPFLHPLAEARASENGLSGIICTQFGIAPGAGETVPIGAADDGPCVIMCSGLTTGKLLKAHELGSAVLQTISRSSTHPRDHGRADGMRPNLLSGKCGIRGPPRLI